MAGPKRDRRARASGWVNRSAAAREHPVPEIVRGMLAEATVESETIAASSAKSPNPQRRKPPGVNKRKNSVVELEESDGSLPSKPEAKRRKTTQEPLNLLGVDAKEGRGKQDGGKDEAAKVTAGSGNDQDDDIEFEDVTIPPPAARVQTTEIESDDEDEEDEIQFEDVDVSPTFDVSKVAPEPSEIRLELNLSKHVQETVTQRRTMERRRIINREERTHRVEVHKVHILCLLSHVAQRNRWCNNGQVKKILRQGGLLTDKMVRYLNPGLNLSQFGRSESLKNGIKMVMDMFHAKFRITERGMRRALWAEEPAYLDSYTLPEDLDSVHEKEDFIRAARSLEGSRDVGAQLFCALMRSAGVTCRLVCSLQPLPFAAGSPTLAKSKIAAAHKQPRETAGEKKPVYQVGGKELEETPEAGRPTMIRQIGSHPRGLDYHYVMDQAAASDQRARPLASSPASFCPKIPRKIKESAFPIYWVEVLDVANQKWQPVDPVATCTSCKPAKIEPPASDRENSLMYAIAFDERSLARDVTRRYAKAYNAKTRRSRLEGLTSPTPGSSDQEARNAGETWLRRVLRHFRPATETIMATSGAGAVLSSDLEQIEDNELNGFEAREAMPRNLADFKDHPIFALERHLRKCEVLVPGASPSGTVGAGQKPPLEKIYRRRDVRVARSGDKWYRMGRVVRPGETAVKVLAPRTTRRGKGGSVWDDDDDEEDGRQEKSGMGIPIYTFSQTELYEPAPVVNGRVPKNKFGNLDVYVPSMVPRGGSYVEDDLACRAAYVLDVDYAPALVGFQFQGRHGTAVLRGAVVAEENSEAVRATIQGLRDLEEEMDRERRERAALRMWARFLRGLRVRERIWGGSGFENEGEDREREYGIIEEDVRKTRLRRPRNVVSDEEDDNDEDTADYHNFGSDSEGHQGSGFLPEKVDDDHDAGRELIPEEDEDDYDDYGAGGFLLDDMDI